MTTNNRFEGSENQSFKQIEGDGWTSIYLPAICAGIIMTIVLFVAIACSKKSETTASSITPPTQTQASAPAPGTVAVANSPEKPKKVKKHRPVSATYVNGTYGVSFTFPRKYSLAAGSGKSISPVPTSFLKPGAVQVAALDVPDDSYPETDFSSALLNLSVNPGMSVEECSQFVPTGKDGQASKPSVIKMGSNEYTSMETMSGETARQSDLKYYHLFKNDACYEFVLDVETSRKADEDLAQVDRGQVFKQLEKVLATAHVKEVQLPGSAKSEAAAVNPGSAAVAATEALKGSESKAPGADLKGETGTTPLSTTPAEDAGTQKAQVVAPEQK